MPARALAPLCAPQLMMAKVVPVSPRISRAAPVHAQVQDACRLVLCDSSASYPQSIPSEFLPFQIMETAWAACRTVFILSRQLLVTPESHYRTPDQVYWDTLDPIAVAV